MMKFKFDPNQAYQVQAIEATVDILLGQPRIEAAVPFQLGTLSAVANRLDLTETDLLKNVQRVQAHNHITPDQALKYIEEEIETASGNRTVRFPNFSIEMETGTGKTYVYLRTILELHKHYGLRKFIVVVPSVAVREGVLKTLSITQDHFARYYGNPVTRYYQYDSANLSQVRQFALSDAIEIMVMTIDSFNKSANVIRQSLDRLQGEIPLYLIQATRPILILDEPQNMESEKSIAAIASLNPLFALRYSATHRNPYNLINRLTPYEAYRQGLVKRIEVHAAVTENDANQVFIRVEDIQTQKRTLTARLAVHKLMKSGTVKETVVTVKPGDSLEQKTSRPEYQGFEVDEIHFGLGYVRFANNIELQLGEEQGTDKEAIFKAQIHHTIEEHFRKQASLKARGIKVLSLFFIDRVSNYAEEDGLIRQIFNQSFTELKARYPDWQDVESEDVQAGYFAQKRRKGGIVEILDSSSGEAEPDQVAYDLIMKDKESLLSFPEAGDDGEIRRKKQVSFIFSHSALREGWDNPNVFQICTLNQSISQVKKRQEVGRGVRLAVDQTGERIHDEQVNILTVIANESYRRYVETLQSEIAFEYQEEIEARFGKPLTDLSAEERRKVEEEYGQEILPPPPRQAGTSKAQLQKARVLNPEFEALWDRIKQKTRYAIAIDTEQLLDEVVSEINKVHISAPRVTITKASVHVDDQAKTFEAIQISAIKTVAHLEGRFPLPNLIDVMANLMAYTSSPVPLTRHTLLEILRRVENQDAAVQNPHEFASVAVATLKEKLADHLVNGIRYEKINEWYEMSRILDEEEVELFSKYTQQSTKAPYDLIPCDSEVETRFVKELEGRRDVKLYVKLPAWFTVPTPIGDYNPDWAVVIEDENGKDTLYMVAETKSTTNLDDLRPDERRKICCGASHFGSSQSPIARDGALQDISYKVVTSASELP